MNLIPAPVPVVSGEVCGNGFFLESNPFRVGSMRYVEGVEPGASLTAYAAAARAALPRSYAGHIQIWVGENAVPEEHWARVRPKPGAQVYVRVRPQGGGGKNVLRAVIMIAVIAVAVYFLGPAAPIWSSIGVTGATAVAAASAAAIAAVTMVATLALNALIPPPGITGLVDNKDVRYSLTGSQNRYVPYAPVPRLFGKLKMFPVLAARPFTENVGKHQYLRLLLLVGWGPIKVSDIRIGNTPISAFRNCSYEIHEGGPDGWAGNKTITLYNRRVTETDLSIELFYNSPSLFQTTALNCVEIECDVTFPLGMIEYQDDGERDSRTVRHRFEYRVAGSGGSWTKAPLQKDNFTGTAIESGGVLVSSGKTPEVVRHSARWKVPEGQYEVRITRLTVAGLNPSGDGDVELDRSFWTVIRSFSTDVAVVQEGVCLIALRLRATDQLNGVPQQISCVAESYLPVYSAAQTTEGAELVTNGDGNATTGWTELNAGRSSLTAVGGCLRITRTPASADGQSWYQDIAVTSGQTYRLRGKLYPNGTTADTARIALVNGSTTLYSFDTDGAEIDETFVASGSSVRIRIEAADSGGSWIVDDDFAEFDNISLKLQTTAPGWAYQITSSPAWAFADVFRRRGGEVYLPDARIDMDAIADWATECATTAPNASEPRWTFNGVIEGGSIYDAARHIAALGRAAYTLKDGKHSVVRDKQQATPVQHITPRNSWGYSGSRTFADLPHALRVEFVNKDMEYQVDELIVYADGYDSTNATKFEVMSLLGATSATLAFREARYHLAVGKLRPEEHRISMDVENLRCTLGDRVQLSHDVISVGKGWGRIAALTTSGANTTGFVLDGPVEFEAATTYQLRVRHADGSTSLRAVTAAGTGFYDTISCTAETTAGGPAVGDLFLFGESGIESLPAIVKRIEPGDDLSAVLTLAPYDEDIYTADTGTIPDFDSYLTASPENTAPGDPAVVIRSDHTAAEILFDGTVVFRLGVDLTPPPSSIVALAGFEVQFRLHDIAGDVEEWQASGGLWPPETTTVFCGPVHVGQAYDARARVRGENGLYSDWTEVTNHTVVGNDVAPQEPTGTSVSPGPLCNVISWVNPANKDLATVEVLAHTTNTFASATVIGMSSGGQFVHSDLEPGVTYYYWLRSENTSGYAAAEISVGSGAALPASTTGSNEIKDDWFGQAWTLTAGAAKIVPEATGGYAAGNEPFALELSPDTATVRSATGELVPVVAGQRYFFSARCSRGTTLGSGSRLNLGGDWIDDDGTTVVSAATEGTQQTPSTLTAGAIPVEVQWSQVAPAGAAYFRPKFYTPALASSSGTFRVEAPRVSRSEPGAAATLNVGFGPPSISGLYDHTNTTAQDLPKSYDYFLYQNGVLVTSGVTFDYRVISGTINGFTSASGWQSMTVTDGAAEFTLNSIGASGVIEIRGTVANGNASTTVTITKLLADAPNNGSSTAEQTSGFSAITTTSFAAVTGDLVVTLPTGKTQTDTTFFFTLSPSGTGTWSTNIEIKLQENVSGTWTDRGSPSLVNSNPDPGRSFDPETGTVVPNEGEISASIAHTGLTAGTTKTYRLVGRNTTTARTISVSGSVLVSCP